MNLEKEGVSKYLNKCPIGTEKKDRVRKRRIFHAEKSLCVIQACGRLTPVT